MEIEHFSHLEGYWNWCPVCTQQIWDPAYGNSKSRFNIHKPCVELPREIQHPFHPQHPLTLVKNLPDGSSSFDCCACSLSISGFAYQCIPCQTFFLDISCASLMPVTTNNDSDDAAQRLLFTHPHPLILCNNNRGFNQSCSACQLLLTDSIYVCLICKLLLHKSCAELPKKIKHPFHQKHTLTLSTKYDGSPFSCKACRMPCGRLTYHCSKCDHSLHVKCASPVRTVRSEIHHHSLAFVNSTHPSNFDCEVCGGNFTPEFDGGNFMTPEFCDDNFPMPKFFRCVDCKFNIHLKCIPTLPETIKYDGHRHRLTVTDLMVKDRPDEDERDPTIEYYCDACEKPRHLFDRTYYCAECHYVSHVDCDSVASEVIDLLETESFLAKENTDNKKLTSKEEYANYSAGEHSVLLLLFIFSLLLLLLSDSYRSKGRCLVRW